MVAATARQRWLVGVKVGLGFDEVFGWFGLEVLGCMEEAEGISFGFLVWF
jgi:hypothetical protein